MGRVSVWEDKGILEVDGGDGCTSVCMCLVPLNCTLKSAYGGIILCVFYHTLKKTKVIDVCAPRPA